MINNVKKFLFFLLLFFTNSYSGVVCLNPGISGYEKSAQRAKHVLLNNTNKIENAKVYIEKDIDGDFYYHSNFLAKDSEDLSKSNQNPTKIAGFSELSNVELAMQNILFPGRSPSIREVDSLYDNLGKIELILDDSVFSKSGNTDLDYTGFQNISYKSRKSNSKKNVLIYNNELGSNQLLIPSNKCCIYSKPRTPSNKIFKELNNKKYQKNDTKFVSLIINSSTDNAINKSSLNRINLNLEKDLSNQLRRKLIEMKGKTLIVLGHIEGKSYVIKDSLGQKKSEIKLAKLREMANQYSVQLIDFGCNSAKINDTKNTAIGVASKFNSLHAVELINKAHIESKNYSEFLFNISSNKIPIIISRDIFKHVDISLYVNSKIESDSGVFISPLGTINISFGNYYLNQEFSTEPDGVDLVDPSDERGMSQIQRALKSLKEENRRQ